MKFEKGPLVTDLFDAFFALLIGIWYFWVFYCAVMLAKEFFFAGTPYETHAEGVELITVLAYCIGRACKYLGMKLSASDIPYVINLPPKPEKAPDEPGPDGNEKKD